MKKIKLGIVGLGHRGRHLLELATKFDSVQVIGCCDLNPELFENPQSFPIQENSSIRERHPAIRFFTDFTAMLDESGIDALLVETPADCHAHFCAAALRRNIHVLSDIPSVNNLAEAELLFNTEQQSDAMFMTGANTMEWGFVKTLEDLHTQGFLGKPFYLEAEYIHDIQDYFSISPWRRHYMPIRYCTHSLGPLLKILPGELREVSCFSTGSHTNRENGQHDLMTAHFKTNDDTIIRLTISFINHAGCGEHSFRVFGTDGYFERLSGGGYIPPRTAFRSKKFSGAPYLTLLPIDLEQPKYRNIPEATGHGGADYALLDRFFRAIADGGKGQSPISLKEGLCMTLPGLFAAYSAQSGGRVIPIFYPWDKDFRPDLLDNPST